ncbi:transposase family protein [Spiroplasma poulsonii]|uniref:transposase family protein n=1 Tax=Spiroplasma poulsonii TaxID=2138 RepID=UPI003A5C7DC9
MIKLLLLMLPKLHSNPTPKKRQKQSYSGKKKKHTTIKTQVIIEQETKKIIATSFSLGKKHDYALFKESKIPILKKKYPI